MMKSNKIIFMEVLRIIAILAVITVHVTSVYLNQFSIGSLNWMIMVLFNSLSRFAVPVFFMISGVCFLELKLINELKDMKKYIFHILLLIVVWGTIYSIENSFLYNNSSILKMILLVPVNILSGESGYHLWFLYDLLGIYLATPYISKLVHALNKKQLEQMVLLWGFVEGIVNYGNKIVASIPAISFIQLNLQFPMIITYCGFFILGYYIYHYQITFNRNKSIITLIISSLIMIMSNIGLSMINNSNVTVFSDNCGIFNIINSIIIFSVLQMNETQLKTFNKTQLILKESGCVMGIYLIHVLINDLLFHVIEVPVIFNSLISILFYVIVVFFASFTLVTICSKVKFIQKVFF